MDWNAIADTAERQKLAQTLVALTPEFGWRQSTLERASAEVLSTRNGWRTIFPRGARDAIWHISLVSDASMKRKFEDKRVAAMSEVIDERLKQNVDLKPFVRQVMLFDIVHPVQALARMQRTSKVMYACLSGEQAPNWFALTCLNLAYTAVVFVWLFDRTPDDMRTKTASRRLMRVCGLG
jgi:ubiquinone biosynthesis protein COQ9